MWKILIFSLLVSVVFVQSEKCEKTDEICRPDGGLITPGTPEELGVYCRQKISLMECSLAARLECDPEDGRTDQVKNLIPVAKQICNNETDLYKDLEASVSCLKTNMIEQKDTRCFSMFTEEEGVKKFEKLLESVGITDVTSDEPCFGHLFFETCSIGAAGVKCGATARNAVVNVLEMVTEVLEDPCKSRTIGKQAILVESMEIEYLESQRNEEILTEDSE